MQPDAILQVPNQTSQYVGVCWHKDNKKWEANLKHNQKLYFGGYFDDGKQAAMKVNLLCDKHGKDRKNPMIDRKLDIIQQLPNQTSKYIGVSWNKYAKKWKTELSHNKKKFYGGYFDNEVQAAMNINLLCDKYKIKRKNPIIDKTGRNAATA